MRVQKNNYPEREVKNCNSKSLHLRVEAWKDITDYENLYQVSMHGRVTSLNYRRTGKKKELKLNKNKNGYLKIGLSKNGKTKWMEVHRLVGIAFIPNPSNLVEINHKNGNPSDNNVDNLEWISHRGNILHAYRTGLITSRKGENHHNAKLSDEKIILIRWLYHWGLKQTILLNLFKISYSNINKIVRRKIWRHLKEDNPIRSQLNNNLHLLQISCNSFFENEFDVKRLEHQVTSCNNGKLFYKAVA